MDHSTLYLLHFRLRPISLAKYDGNEQHEISPLELVDYRRAFRAYHVSYRPCSSELADRAFFVRQLKGLLVQRWIVQTTQISGPQSVVCCQSWAWLKPQPRFASRIAPFARLKGGYMSVPTDDPTDRCVDCGSNFGQFHVCTESTWHTVS